MKNITISIAIIFLAATFCGAAQGLTIVSKETRDDGTTETTTSTVDIPSDEMKGRIIGREGRNIRTFEKVTGVDVIIDDTPGVVIVSGFDPVRREIARQSLNKLIADGRIHPSRIEEVFNDTSKEIEVFIQKKGEEAAQEVGVHGVHPKVSGSWIASSERLLRSSPMLARRRP